MRPWNDPEALHRLRSFLAARDRDVYADVSGVFYAIYQYADCDNCHEGTGSGWFDRENLHTSTGHCLFADGVYTSETLRLLHEAYDRTDITLRHLEVLWRRRYDVESFIGSELPDYETVE